MLLAEGALELVEEPALDLAVRVLVAELVELAQQAALLVGEPARHANVHEDPLVAPAPATALQDRHAAAVEDDDLARLRPRRQLELLLPVERRNREGGAERGLREGQVDRRVDVVPFAHESLVGTDPHLDVDVSGAAAGEPGVALAAQADPLAVMNIALDAVERLLPELHAERAITSGYLDRDEPRVEGWHRIECRVRDGWAADLLEFRP